MSNEPNLTPASPEQCAAAAAFMRAAARYYAVMLPSIAPKRLAAMTTVLAEGGWLDAVARVDGALLTRVPIELVAPNGVREEMCSAFVPDLPSKPAS